MGTRAFQSENTLLRATRDGTVEAAHQAYERAVSEVRASFPREHPLRIGGKSVQARGSIDVRSPADRTHGLGRVAAGRSEDVNRAVGAAREAFTSWARTDWAERVQVFETAAERLRQRKFEFAALMSFENGKNRAEALADADEAIDFLAYYSALMHDHDGFTTKLHEAHPGERSTSVLRPYGVFGVVSPFNFPLAILLGMTTGATITGNTAVVKPASATPLVAHAFLDLLEDAGLPPGVVNLVTGSGPEVGDPLVRHADVHGMVFTGSRQVGLGILRTFLDSGKPPGPVIAELGGKNAVVVTQHADLEKAVPGTVAAAFGFAGQKCSAASRVYVHESLHDRFVHGLVQRTNQLKAGHPTQRDAYVTPVITQAKAKEFDEAAARAARDGKIAAGGKRLTEGGLDRGNYVAPTVVTGLPKDHPLARTELFMPFVTVFPVRSLDEAIAEVNRVDYGLTGGIYSEDADEVRRYFDEAQVGVVYANRARSATTGALVGAQAFVGWKFSGTSGKGAGGPYYLQQFLREQSRTTVP